MSGTTQIQPQAFFYFAAENCDLLLELYRSYGDQSIPESQVVQLIKRCANNNSPTSSHILERMCQLGFLEYSPGSDMLYEIPHAIGKLLGHLLHEYRLTSVEVIRAYLSALDQACTELEKAAQEVNGNAIVRILIDADENVDRMRSDSNNNRYKIIAECIKAKINRDKLSVLKRFELINHLYEKYLKPMRDMIDINKEMDSQLERLERVLGACIHAFALDRQIRQMVEKSLARLIRLKKDIDNDFRESYTELWPLYRRFHKESGIARGAANALKIIADFGVKRLKLSSKIGLCQFRTQGLIGDDALEAYIFSISNYQPHIVMINADQNIHNVQKKFVTLIDLKQHLKGLGEIDDVLRWIVEKFSEDSLLQHLRIYGMFHSQILGKASFSEQAQEYISNEIKLKACPMHFKVVSNE